MKEQLTHQDIIQMAKETVDFIKNQTKEDRIIHLVLSACINQLTSEKTLKIV